MDFKIIAAVVIIAAALVVYLVRQNRRDKKEVERFFNEDYTKQQKDELDDEGSEI